LEGLGVPSFCSGIVPSRHCVPGVGVGGVRVIGIEEVDAETSGFCVLTDRLCVLGADICWGTLFCERFLLGGGMLIVGTVNDEGTLDSSFEGESTSGVELEADSGERGEGANACLPNARRISVLGVRTDWASLKAEVKPLILGFGEARGVAREIGVGPRDILFAIEEPSSLERCDDARSVKLYVGVSVRLLKVFGVSDL
jgi:hypothetical protein